MRFGGPEGIDRGSERPNRVRDIVEGKRVVDDTLDLLRNEAKEAREDEDVELRERLYSSNK